MTARRKRPGVGGPGGSAEVISLAAARAGYRRLASVQVVSARKKLDMTTAEFAEYMTGELGYLVVPEWVTYWEDGDAPPGDFLRACDAIVGGVAVGAASLLDSVPPSLAAGALAGPWVTAYQFAHAGAPHYHADIANVAARKQSMWNELWSRASMSPI